MVLCVKLLETQNIAKATSNEPIESDFIKVNLIKLFTKLTIHL